MGYRSSYPGAVMRGYQALADKRRNTIYLLRSLIQIGCLPMAKYHRIILTTLVGLVTMVGGSLGTLALLAQTR